MKKHSGIRNEYDFQGGVGGKYAKRSAKGSNVIVLEPGVARMFPNSKSVNEALKSLVDIARHTKRK